MEVANTAVQIFINDKSIINDFDGFLDRNFSKTADKTKVNHCVLYINFSMF